MCYIHNFLEKLTANFCLDRAQYIKAIGSALGVHITALECKDWEFFTTAAFTSSRQETFIYYIFQVPTSNDLQNLQVPKSIPQELLLVLDTASRVRWLIKASIFNKHIKHAAPLNHLYQKMYKQFLQSS